MNWTGLSVLVTGGSGSLGTAIARRLLTREKPRRVIIYSRDEAKHLDMRETIPDPDERLRFFIGDVRDRDRLRRAMTDVRIAIQAAALKQVPACEYNIIEAIRTNVDGAANFVDACIDAGVARGILVSTDKASAPSTAYGATKLVAERLFVHSNVYARDTCFSALRYGNVAGSRGSVIPVWRDAMARGQPIQITSPTATRFWITMDQAVEFVLTSVERMEGGEVFIPLLPSASVGDLAEAIAPGYPQSVTGLRAGEKPHEVLISRDEARSARMEVDRYVLRFGEDYLSDPRGRVKEYSSQEPSRRLSISDLAMMISPIMMTSGGDARKETNDGV